ncbi:DUF58 domain-containing protein [Alteromonas sp. C1M14]|uniref:DUF58 domain-containing protein n=1 Tax=Alteromonas sp. C1M14 TaxID=2841567 RepID=UPI001C07F66E|nr:DUF58 domain-containing protein [Alteromonas sp. C1M14]MBU2977361.1 DUF58 domain-containing protein [Alteromonas sp. C1M14]
MHPEHSTLSLLKSDGVELSLPELLRYQSLTKGLNLTPQTPPRALMSGAYLSRQKGRGMEFDEARHYQPGDDIRAIDWRVTARTGKTHTKIYREERERPVFILCDLGKSMHFGSQLLLKSVQASHIAALLSWSAAQRGDKVGAVIFNDNMHRECKPLSRKRAVLSLCHELRKVQIQQITDVDTRAFDEACLRLRRIARPGSLVYLISDFVNMGVGADQHLSHLARHCEMKAIRVWDPMESALPNLPVTQQVSVTDGVNTQNWPLGDKSLTTRYSEWRSHITQQIHQQFESKRIHLTDISAGLPLEQQFDNFRGRL